MLGLANEMAPLLDRFSDSNLDDARRLQLPGLALGLGAALEGLSALDDVPAGKYFVEYVVPCPVAFLGLHGDAANEVAPVDEALPDRVALFEGKAGKDLIEGGARGPATVVEGDQGDQSSTTAGDMRS
jgi:hypothetical protein